MVHVDAMLLTLFCLRVPQVCDSEWHHLSLSVQFPSVTLYVDGVTFDPALIHDNGAIPNPAPRQRMLIGACWGKVTLAASTIMFRRDGEFLTQMNAGGKRGILFCIPLLGDRWRGFRCDERHCCIIKRSRGWRFWHRHQQFAKHKAPLVNRPRHFLRFRPSSSHQSFGWCSFTWRDNNITDWSIIQGSRTTWGPDSYQPLIPQLLVKLGNSGCQLAVKYTQKHTYARTHTHAVLHSTVKVTRLPAWQQLLLDNEGTVHFWIASSVFFSRVLACACSCYFFFFFFCLFFLSVSFSSVSLSFFIAHYTQASL